MSPVSVDSPGGVGSGSAAWPTCAWAGGCSCHGPTSKRCSEPAAWRRAWRRSGEARACPDRAGAPGAGARPPPLALEPALVELDRPDPGLGGALMGGWRPLRPDTIPPELRAAPWVLWRAEPRGED